MRVTQTFLPTLRQAPKEAEARSHVYMLRAGLIRSLAAGLYTFLPLGQRALQKVERVIREEMDRAGALEVRMPSLQPQALWKRSGRWETMGPELMRLQDHSEREFVLGPGHEEVIADLLARGLVSYRDLPKCFYQIQTRFRDEIRPRFGVIQAKEFLMKDAYSFDGDEEGLERSYQVMMEAYRRIFERCGIRVLPVQADPGWTGGGGSHAFIAPMPAGEAEIVYCEETGFAANREICPCLSPPNDSSRVGKTTAPYEKVATPGMSTVEQVCKFLKVESRRLIKTLIFVADQEPFAVLVRGDREVNELKVRRYLGKPVQLAPPEVIERVTGAPVGFAGPVGLKGVRILADPEVMLVGDGVTGANEGDAHLIHIVPGRDFDEPELADLRLAVEGDPCPTGKPGKLRLERGTEVGRVGKLGTRYSEAFGAVYTDDKGERRPLVMGGYGINLSRTLAAAIEQNSDERGILWPASLAPYDVHVLPLGVRQPFILDAAERITLELEQAGFEVLLDDRDESPGVKFNDADLLGLPLRVIIGKRSLDEDRVEVARRERPGEKRKVRVDEVCRSLKQDFQDGRVVCLSEAGMLRAAPVQSEGKPSQSKERTPSS